ncbi:hypothetical protein AVEN_53853-1 [Araneus ventricosus]|uniref:Uncharacterized protein n=1 Tax=Araneus ventricosus TaxID=182803 RepID=A0A4Y2KDG5_ARAVE|nr:hypothetical protein AVEN_53853-1 [Araneus ventricosus]
MAITVPAPFPPVGGTSRHRDVANTTTAISTREARPLLLLRRFLIHVLVVPPVEPIKAYSAAETYEKYKKLKKRAKEISFTLRCLEDTKDDGKLLLKFIRSKEKLICTTSGIFTLTKSFLPAAASVFITFNLLLLQLDTKG